jgi:hypothetical protein
MMGRAGRPQFDTVGKSVIMVHEPKKGFYKKFVYNPFPVESALHEKLPDHLNAEIVNGTISSTQGAVDYLTWTYYFRRLPQNPAFYGLRRDAGEETISAHLTELIQDTLESLEVRVFSSGVCACMHARGVSCSEQCMHAGCVPHCNALQSVQRAGAVLQSGAYPHAGAVLKSGVETHAGAVLHLGAYTHAGAILQSGACTHAGAVLHLGAYTHAGAILQSGACTHAGAVLYLGAYTHAGAILKSGACTHAGAVLHLGAYTHAGRSSHQEQPCMVELYSSLELLRLRAFLLAFLVVLPHAVRVMRIPLC